MKKRVSLLLLSLVSLTLAAIWASAQQRSDSQLLQEKIDSQLLQAMRQRRRPAAGDERQETLVEIDADGRVLVDISARVTPELTAYIRRLGGTILSQFEQYHTIRARVPLRKLERLARRTEVRFIMPAARATTNSTNRQSHIP